jgi:hypothetical protein
LHSDKKWLPGQLIDIILDSYKDAVVRAWNQGEALGPVAIRKGAKQGCPLSSLLFNI